MRRAYEEEEEIEEQWPAGVDSDGDGFDNYDELLTGHDPQDPNDTPKHMEVEDAISEFRWEDSDEDGFDDYDEHIQRLAGSGHNFGSSRETRWLC